MQLETQRKSELRQLLRHDCGSCHGMTLKGGLGPSLLPASLMQKNDEYLFSLIKFGRQENAMPPWGPILKDNEIKYIIQLIREYKNEN